MPTGPSSVSAALRTHKRRQVLLALGWYAGQIHHGVAQFAREAGWILNLEALRSGTAPPTWRGDGIIAILGSNSRMDRQLHNKRVPIVNIGHGGPAQVPTVVPDNRAIARLALEHFSARGFHHFAGYLVSGGPGERVRYDAFSQVVASKKLELHSLDWTSQLEFGRRGDQARLNWLKQALFRLPKPLAVFAEFDDRAVEILQACDLAGIPVPEQIAVLGVDNDALRCDFAPVPLSSIDDDQHRQGYAAAEILGRILDGEAPPQQPVLVAPRDVVTRRSTDILAVEHPVVAAALRAIWEHYREPIQASDIAEMFPMSARRLHDAFCRHIGHSIADELARKRIEFVKTQLATTDQKLVSIARGSGFSSPDHLSKVFTRLEGMPPVRYRQRRSGAGSG